MYWLSVTQSQLELAAEQQGLQEMPDQVWVAQLGLAVVLGVATPACVAVGRQARTAEAGFLDWLCLLKASLLLSPSHLCGHWGFLQQLFPALP